ncbi:MAG: hypothetical protein JWN74_3181 [Acidobacteriaceae bacterium]|nr:hypothetical protein [Acidobacteriaceae bacterium]
MTQKIKANRKFSVAAFGLLALGILLFPLPTFSQGCALCYTQAASSGAQVIAALKSGILILVLPPTLGSIGMLFIVHRKRNQIRRDEQGVESDQEW